MIVCVCVCARARARVCVCVWPIGGQSGGPAPISRLQCPVRSHNEPAEL